MNVDVVAYTPVVLLPAGLHESALFRFWVISWALALFTIPFVLLHRRGRPMAALSWFSVLFFMPPLGLLVWWLLGWARPAARRRARVRRREALAGGLREAQARGARPDDPVEELSAVVDKASRLLGDDAVFPPSRGNYCRLLVGAREAYTAWEEAIRGATDHVHAIFYIWRPDAEGRRLRDALIDRARAGVEVRVLVDAIGSLTSRVRRFFHPLRAVGGNVVFFEPGRGSSLAPPWNFRNHRKILIVDGQRSFVGGLNIGEEYLRWHDLAMEIRGPGVDQLQEVFAQDWFFRTGCQVCDERFFGRWAHADTPAGGLVADVSCATVSSGPDMNLSAIHEMLLVAIAQARRRLWIMTPYLLPDPALLSALRTAVYRGVDVRILVPAENDIRIVRRATRAFYPALIGAGIALSEYPGMLHAKAVIFDDHLVLIGSANMDTRSFRLNYETSTFLVSEPLAAQVRALFEASEREAHTLSLDDYEVRVPWWDQIVDATAHLLSPLL